MLKSLYMRTKTTVFAMITMFPIQSLPFVKPVKLLQTYQLFSIQWDIDPEDDDGVELPNEITIPNDIEDEEAISDYISDVTGFCHKGFELEEQL